MVLRQESTLTKALGTPTPPSLKVTAPARQVGSRVAVSVACTRFSVPPVTRIARLTAHIMPAHNHYAGSLGSAMAVITATRSMTRNAAAYDLCGDRRVRLLQWGIPDPVREVQLCRLWLRALITKAAINDEYCLPQWTLCRLVAGSCV